MHSLKSPYCHYIQTLWILIIKTNHRKILKHSKMRSNSPRNSRYHHHRRSPSPCDHPKRQRSFSPSPPRASKNELQAIRITVNNVPSRKPKKFTIFKAREEFQGLEQVSLPRSKDQKKIQIEIRRIIPKHRESQSPVRRSIRDHTTVFILRKKGSRLFQQFIYFDALFEIFIFCPKFQP